MKYDFTPNNCWYNNVCSDSQTENCTIYCIRFGQMKHMIESSCMPKTLCYPIKLSPAVADLQAFKQLDNIRKNIVEFVTNGQNLYIFSAFTGNGKTTWSAKLMLKYFESVWQNNCYKERGLFISTTNLLLQARMFGYRDDKTQSLLHKIMSIDLVIWDDIGVGQLTAQDLDLLYSLIDHRTKNGLSNIFTGNLGGDNLKQIIGERLYSRVWTNSTVVEFVGNDRRGLK